MTVLEWMAAVVSVIKAHLQQSECDVVKFKLLEAGLISGDWKPDLREVRGAGAERMRRHRSKKRLASHQASHSVTCDVTSDVTSVTMASHVTSPVTSQTSHLASQASHVTSHVTSHLPSSPLQNGHCNGVDTYPESSESDSDSESESDSDQIKILQRKRESAEREKEGKVGVVTPAASRRQRRIPPTFEPSTQLLAWAALNAPLVNFEDELAVIRDYEFKNPYSDWPAVVRNWLRKAQQQQQDRNAKLGIVPPPVFRDDDDSMDGVFL